MTKIILIPGKNHDFSSRLIEVSNALNNLKMIVLSEENKIFNSKLECNFRIFNNFGEDRDLMMVVTYQLIMAINQLIIV